MNSAKGLALRSRMSSSCAGLFLRASTRPGPFSPQTAAGLDVSLCHAAAPEGSDARETAHARETGLMILSRDGLASDTSTPAANCIKVKTALAEALCNFGWRNSITRS
jgi:hypothetical protein